MPADPITECITRVVEKTAGPAWELVKGLGRGAYRYGVRPAAPYAGAGAALTAGVGGTAYATRDYWRPWAGDQLGREMRDQLRSDETKKEIIESVQNSLQSPETQDQLKRIAQNSLRSPETNDQLKRIAVQTMDDQEVGRKLNDVTDKAVNRVRDRVVGALPKLSPATLGALAVGVPTLAGLAFSRPGRRKRGLGRGLAVGLGTLAGGAVARATGGPTPGIGRTALGAGIGALAGHLAGGALAGRAGDDREGG